MLAVCPNVTQLIPTMLKTVLETEVNFINCKSHKTLNRHLTVCALNGDIAITTP